MGDTEGTVGAMERNLKCRVQNANVKNKENDTVVKGHPSTLQFEIYNLHFALIAAIGRAVHGGFDES
jgi:hypothetical protein